MHHIIATILKTILHKKLNYFKSYLAYLEKYANNIVLRINFGSILIIPVIDLTKFTHLLLIIYALIKIILISKKILSY